MCLRNALHTHGDQSPDRTHRQQDTPTIEDLILLHRFRQQVRHPACVFEHLEGAIHDYIDYYNHSRIKIKLGGLSPVEYRTRAART